MTARELFLEVRKELALLDEHLKISIQVARLYDTNFADYLGSAYNLTTFEHDKFRKRNAPRTNERKTSL